MGLSKSNRIVILLVIDSAFFLVELITGYAVHSLALVADSFHMLNDVLSLCVGLWAVKVANSTTNSEMYTYGWQRAETLGALVNGVFLVALCVTIFLDAIQRFVEPQVVTNPKLVLIVGCLGLASNLLGLLLFHDHSHGHGGHSHGNGDDVGHAEEGRSHAHSHDHDHAHVADERGNVVDVLPQNRVANWPTTQTTGTAADDSTAGKGYSKRKHSRSGSRFSDVNEVPVTPRDFRRAIIDASLINQTDPEEDAIGTQDEMQADAADSQDAPLLSGKRDDYGTSQSKPIDHKQHKHRQPKDAGSGHGHSHGDLNMRGIFLHVMGDALGNVGVIVTALVIWLTKYSWRYYFDPAISLVITIIILCSAIPLCKAASRILLQAVPYGISVDDIKEDILDLPGITGCHHLHVWQLSDTKLVASLHVQVDFDFKGEGSARYMKLAQAIRQCLQEYGIRSVTIQPEFCINPEHNHSSDLAALDQGNASGASSARRSSRRGSKASTTHGENACLLECSEDCGKGKSCCASTSRKNSSDENKPDGHDHAH